MRRLLIRNMTATFGKLDNVSMSLQPGLNIIYAPNESGKSTWCHFIRTMLYGLPSRDRGALADKNRFTPWNGGSMRGSMDAEIESHRYTIVRDTLRPTSPMGAFSCTYTDTATEVSHITAQSVGESLLGVGREVFSRSAFITQSGLPLDGDAELERRISALVSSGQEDISFSESYERLKKQLNRHKHNKTGLIPSLEAEIAQLSVSLQQIQSLHEQEAAAKEQLQQYTRQAEELQQRLAQWDALQKQDALRRCLQAEIAAKEASALAASLQFAAANLPSAAELNRLEGMAATLDQTLAQAESAAEDARNKQHLAKEARSLWQQHPLHPKDENQLTTQLQALQPKRFSLWAVAASLFLSISLSMAFLFLLPNLAPLIVLGSGAAMAAAILLIYNCIRRKRNRILSAQQSQLQTDSNIYLSLYRQYCVSEEEAKRAISLAKGLHDNCRQGLLQLLGQVQPFAPQATNLTNVRGMLDAAIIRRAKLDKALQAAAETQSHAELLRAHLPAGPLPDPQQVLFRPSTSQQQLQEALPRTLANAQNARSQLDTLSGQLRAAGDRDVLESRLAQKRQQLQKLQQEYSAIAAAMVALEQANCTMQSRFSPLLGRRAAEIFSAFTGGKYQKVFLQRDFSVSAEPHGDIASRSVHLLSQGAADQLYLAVRLAICEMVLPAENACPIILDDALANFDDERLHYALNWLADEGSRRQILLFTCQKREGDYLAGRSGIHVLSL